MSLRPLPILRRLCPSSCGRVCDQFGSGAKSVKQFQIFVSIPPEEVVRRIASAIDKPGLGLAVPFGGKDFFGTINGLAFRFRNRRRWSRNNFAPGCFGNIQPNGYGSTINVQIAAKNTLFLIFAIVFVLFVTLGCGLFGALALVMLTQTSQPGPKDFAVPVGLLWQLHSAFAPRFYFTACPKRQPLRGDAVTQTARVMLA